MVTSTVTGKKWAGHGTANGMIISHQLMILSRLLDGDNYSNTRRNEKTIGIFKLSCRRSKAYKKPWYSTPLLTKSDIRFSRP